MPWQVVMKINLFLSLALGSLWTACGQVAVNGVVNSASWAAPVASGSVVAIFGTELANVTSSANGFPLPTNISGTSVIVNGAPAPLLFVSPGQINAQMPSYAATHLAGAGSLSLTVTAPAGTSPSIAIAVSDAAPGIFTDDSSGCGQAAALNITPAGDISLNSSHNSAQPGDYLAIFGTGFGQPVLPVNDGTASPPGRLTSENGVVLGGTEVSALTYDGLAPTLVGVDQINFRIPADVPTGCAIPINIGSGYQSPTATVSIRSGGGQCVDPAPSFYGQVTLVKSAGATDLLTAVFPSGPNVRPPELMLQNSYNNITPLAVSRSCIVPGQVNLSAGAITIQGPGGTATALPTVQPGGVVYQASLPSGFVQPGQFTLSSAPNQPVTFAASMQVDTPIQLQTTLAPGTILSASQGVSIQWTGGNPEDRVRIQLVTDPDGFGIQSNTYVTSAGAGSLTLNGNCVNFTPPGEVCSWGLPTGAQVQLIVDVFPSGGTAATSNGTQFLWDYRYVFKSLVLGN